MIVTMIQARTGSSRLPNKILLPLAGAPLLLRMIERVQASPLAKNSGPIVVVTTTDPSDDAVVDLCRNNSIEVFRGHPTDLLDRHYQAALRYQAESAIKIPSDCPLIDPKIIDRVIGFYLSHLGQYDFVSNLHPATYPDGNDVEIMTMEALAKAWREAKRPLEREHTTPYLWENPELFRCANLTWETGLNYSMSHRWTIDYPEDYEFIKRVYDELYPENPLFGIDDILGLLKRKPEIAAVNQELAGVNWYRHHLGELKTVTERETRQK